MFCFLLRETLKLDFCVNSLDFYILPTSEGQTKNILGQMWPNMQSICNFKPAHGFLYPKSSSGSELRESMRSLGIMEGSKEC